MKKWQDRWDKDNRGRTYYKIQENISAQGVMTENRKEETVLTRLRFEHTGLNKTLLLIGTSGTDKCLECNIIENTEYVLMHCRKYRKERIK